MAKLTAPIIDFPAVESALSDPNGLLAVGGDLSRLRLIKAYSIGVFPWYEQGQPLLWWSPDPRAVIFTRNLHVSTSLKKTMRKQNYSLSFDRAFEQVIDGCAGHRKNETGTWITAEMRQAYIDLHKAGHAHSVEVWDESELVGGLYGVASGQVFSGESMFHHRSDASKIAFVTICLQLRFWGWPLLDCQISNPHLESLGVEEIPRAQFKTLLPGYSASINDNIDDNSIAIAPWGAIKWRSTRELLEDLE